MRNFSRLAAAVAVCFQFISCTPSPVPHDSEDIEKQSENQNDTDSRDQDNQQNMAISITIGDKAFIAEIDNSETGKAFIAKLPLTLDMSELNGNEKYCYGVELPRADKHFDSIVAGDLMLYSGNCVVLFYGSAGGYNYTRIGRLTSTDGLKEALGAGSVRITFAKQE